MLVFVGVWCAIGEPVYRIRGMDLWVTLAFSASLDGFDSRHGSIMHQPFLFFYFFQDILDWHRTFGPVLLLFFIIA